MNKKYIYSSLITFIFCLNDSFCQEKSDYAILSGTVKNGNKTIELRAQYDSQKKGKIIHLNNDGTFLDSINIQKEELYFISDKTNMILFYLIPSRKYILEYDTKKFKSEGITLKGDDININEYYIDKTRNSAFYDINESGKSEKELRSSLKNIKEKQLERLNTSKLPSSLKMDESATINYEYITYLSLYIGLNSIDNPSIETKNELNIDYSNEEDYKKYASYKYLVLDYYREQLSHKVKEYKKLNPSYSLNQNAIKELASIVPNDYIKNELIASSASLYLLNSKDIEACYNDFKKYYTGDNTSIKAEILDLYNRFSKLKKGTPSPKFTNYKNYNGAINALDDFKGTFVFIDIWATWCGNCFAEMFALKKLEKEYKNIVFLSIAWKDDEDKWRTTIKKESLTGVQLLATKEDNSFFQGYAINDIPRYILIDPKGNIVDYSTPRPSDENLKELFKSVGID